MYIPEKIGGNPKNINGGKEREKFYHACIKS